MTFEEFKAVWDAKDGWNTCSCIIFDNSGRWILNERKYTPYYDENGRFIPNDSRSFGDFLPVRDYIFMNEELGTIEKKMFIRGLTSEDRNGTWKDRWFNEVRHVENIQAMWFCENPEYRPWFDPNMT